MLVRIHSQITVTVLVGAVKVVIEVIYLAVSNSVTVI